MAETPSELQTEIAKLERKHAENPEGRYFVPLANTYRRIGWLKSAESLLRDGLQWHPEYLSAHIVLGRCLAERGAADEAAEEFRYVLSLDPQNLIALRSLGEIALGAGRAEEAERWYRELIAADPMNDDARRGLASLQPADSEPVPGDGPVEDADDLPMLEEDVPELVTETIAELYARQGLHDRSAEVYRELIRRRGGDPALERRLAEVERSAAGTEPPPLAAPDMPVAGWELPVAPSGEPEEDAAPPFAGPEDEGDDSSTAFALEPEAGPTIAAFLSELAAWRPGAPRSGGTATAADGVFRLEEEEDDEREREALLSHEQPLGGSPERVEGPGGGERARETAPPATLTPSAGEDDDDLESFQAWLRSLKR